MSRIQCLESRRRPAGAKSGFRMGPIWHPGQHTLTRLHRHRHGGGTLQAIPGAEDGMADAEHARQVERSEGVQGSCCISTQRRVELHDRCGSEDRWWAYGLVGWCESLRRICRR